MFKIWGEIMELNISNAADIKRLLRNDDYLVRCDTIAALEMYNDNKEICDIIIEMLNDKNYLVRCEACEALYGVLDSDVLGKLMSRLKIEKSSVVRMYIVSNICQIIKSINYDFNIVDELAHLFNKEKSKRVIIAYLCVFYVMSGDKKFIYAILNYMNDEDYHIRHNAVNLLNDIVDKDNIEIVTSGYKNRLIREDAYSVRDLLERSLEELTVKGE